MTKKYKKIVIGVDQSYKRTGISIGIDGELKKVGSLDFKGLESRSEKRKHLSNVLSRLLKKATQEALETIIICERIRTFSNDGAKKAKGGFGGLKPDYIKMTGALVGRIVDTGMDYNVETYSVDTRSWKSKIVGSSKAKKDKDGKRDAKSETVNFIQGKGFDLFIREKKNGKNKGEKIFDDDAADSACMCLYGFLPTNKQILKLEE